MVFSNRSSVQGLVESILEEGSELVCLRGRNKAINQLKQRRFDLAVIDSSLKNVETICLSIRKYGAFPLVLVICEPEVNWPKLQSLGVDGYLSEGAGVDELRARLKATLRRLNNNNKPLMR